MKLIISENQYNKLILESSKDSLTDFLSDLKEFASTVIEKTQSEVGINLKMLTIWGAGVGGIMVPLNEFIENGNFNLNDFQTASILCATAAILYGESKGVINELVKVKELKQQVQTALERMFEHPTASESNRIEFYDDYKAACEKYEAHKQQLRTKSVEYKERVSLGLVLVLFCFDLILKLFRTGSQETAQHSHCTTKETTRNELLTINIFNSTET